MENVTGLVHLDDGKYYEQVMQRLKDVKGYMVTDAILNTKDHGIPHSRRGWYCVGVREDVNNGTFRFPDQFPCTNIERFLNHRDNNLALNGIPPESQGMARINVKTKTS